MSGIVKSVGKIFRKVAKIAKKVLPVVLAAAAIYFTAGAAMGIAGTANGWGQAVSGLTSRLGLGSTLGNIVTGAVTQAGYGAALGGGLALVTGGDVKKGLLSGALGGAISGGVMGGLGFSTDPLAGIGGETPAAATGPPLQLGPSVTTGPLAPLPANPTTVGGAAGTGLAASVDVPFASTPIPGTGFNLPVLDAGAGTASKGGFFSRLSENPLAGQAIQGLGKGLLAYAGSRSEAEATEKAAQLKAETARREREAIAANFGTGTGRGLLSSAYPFDDTAQRPTPPVRFAPQTAFGGGRYEFNPGTGRVEWVPTVA